MSLRKAKSETAGNGIFTDSSIESGEKVFTLTGERISMVTFFVRLLLRVEREDDPLQISRFSYLDLEPFSRTFNHSCEPNCGIRGESDLVAIKNISAGDELTYEYATTVSPEISWWSMPCNCGVRSCRKLIRPANYLSLESIEKYDALGVLPAHAKIKYHRYSLPFIFYSLFKLCGLIPSKN